VSGLEEEIWAVVVEGEERVWFALVILSPLDLKLALQVMF